MRLGFRFYVMPLMLTLTLTAFSISGCCSAPVPQFKIVTIPAKQKTYSVSYELIKYPETCSEIVTSKSKRGAYYHYADLCPAIYDNVDVILNGLFSPTVLPQGASPDLFVVARVLSSSAVIEGFAASYSPCTFSIEIGFSFLDPERDPILEVAAKGQVTSDVGLSYKSPEVATQRAYDAVEQAMTKLGREILQSSEVECILANVGFFKLDDQAKARALDTLFVDHERMTICGPLLMAYAIKKMDGNLLNGLLVRGVSPARPSSVEGYYPVHWAAMYNNVNAITRLVAAGADINQQDSSGKTPLFYSAWNGNTEVTEKLLSMASDLDIAKEEYPMESAVILESFGDYYMSLWEKERARRSYEHARALLVRTSADYERLSTDVSRKKFWRYVGMGLLAAGQSYGDTYNARLQQQFNKMAALRHASESGTNYYKSLDYLNKKTNFVIIPRQAHLSPEQIDTLDLDTRKKVLEKLKEVAEEQTEQIERKLAAQGRATNYVEFREIINR